MAGALPASAALGREGHNPHSPAGSRMKTLPQRGFALFALCLFATAASAQDKLPTGQEVVDRFVQVTGGKEKYEAVKTMVATGKYSMPQLESLGVGDGTIEIYFTRPDKARLIVDIPNFGKIEKGQLGKVAWEVNPQTGTRLLEGEEAARFLSGIDMRAQYDPASIYESIENAGVEDVDGQQCYKVTMKRKGSDDVDSVHFSVESGLAIKGVTHEPTPMGTLTVNTVLSDYKEVGGIKSAMKMVQELVELGLTQEITMESIQFNEPIDDSRYELPAAVKELAEEKE
jgi:hypothetical protein